MKKKNMNGKGMLKRILKGVGFFIIGFGAVSFFLMLIMGGPNSKTEIAESKSIAEEYEILQELYSEAKIENDALNAKNSKLKAANDDYRKYLLDNCLLIEVEEEESEDSETPTFTPVIKDIIMHQMSYGEIGHAIPDPHAFVYCPEYSKIRLHFNYEYVPILLGDHMNGETYHPKVEEISCLLRGETVKVEADTENPGYYYVTLDEKGLYCFDTKFKDEIGDEIHRYFFIRW